MTSAIGKLIGQYRLDLPLAIGSLGHTLRATHVVTGEVVAVKLFHEQLAADAAFVERFRPVVQAAADVDHPNVLPIRGFGEQDGQYYVLMDFIASGSLRTLLVQRETRLPLRRALELARQAAEGLAAAHARGVLHRDLKPENLLVEERGATDVMRIADPGLTRLAESSLTIGGASGVGSLPYMSPEQLRGLPIDARSDMYSLGVVLYEIVTGFPPFQVKNLTDALSKHLTATPPAPRSLQSTIPVSLEQLILRALEKDLTKRVQTATEFAGLLQAELNKLPDQPLVVWRGPAIASPPRRAVPAKSNGAGAARRRFTLGPAVVDGGDPTLPPPVERAEPLKPVREVFGGVSRRIGVVLEREALTLVPGQRAILTVTLMNSGRTVDAFALSVRGVDESWVETPAQPQRLNPGQRAVVPLTVLVPRTPASRAGTYATSVVAHSKEAPGEEGSAPATFTVLPFAQTTLALVPPKARGWRRGTFKVSIGNQGNAPARYAIGGRDDEEALGYRLGTPNVALEPGASLDVPLETTASLRPLGGADLRTFTVTALSEFAAGATEPAKSVVGQFVHRALIPTWLPPLLLVAGLALFYMRMRSNQLTLAVVPAAVQLEVGSSRPLAATVKNVKDEAVTTGPPITWSTQDSTIAVVSDSGRVTGVREGPTVITVRAGRRTQAVQVAVVAAKVDKIVLAPKRVTLTVPQMAVLRVTASDSAGRTLFRDPIWQSSDPTVATVGGGRVTAKGAGTATITATIESKSATADVRVFAPPVPVPADSVSKPTEDCIAYEPSSLGLSRDGALGWRVADGSTVIATLDTEDDARKVAALARRYKARCFLGRANKRVNRSDYVIDYWTMPTNFVIAVPGETCGAYDRSTLAIRDEGASGFTLRDAKRELARADTRSDAQKAFDIARNHRATCAIGLKNKRANKRDYIVGYWR